jgi:imidazolonepropionase
MNLLIKNIKQLVTVASNGKSFKAGKEMRELSVIENAAVLIENGIIQRIDSTDELSTGSDIDVLDAGNRVALPGFVDSHTHTVFAGSRENEFSMR